MEKQRRGTKPKCKGCKKTIEHKEGRIRLTKKVNDFYIYGDTHQFHCDVVCLIAGMSKKSLEEFMEWNSTSSTVHRLKNDLERYYEEMHED